MAIYHFCGKVISRNKGKAAISKGKKPQSAVAAAAYRSGEKLVDEKTNEMKFYKREVEPDNLILAPEHAPGWVYDRQKLWNEVEKVEKRNDAQLAREFNIALPNELTNQQQKELIKNFAKKEFTDRGMVADIAIHRDDKNNPHAHIMVTMRPFEKNGEWGAKRVKDQDGRDYKTTDWDTKERFDEWRESWGKHANKALEKAGREERISHLSHEARGYETLPTIHMGYRANELEKQGIKTDRGNINREIKEHNKQVIKLEEYKKEKKELEKQRESMKYFSPEEKADLKAAAKAVKGYVTKEKIEQRYQQLDRWEQSLQKSKGYLEWKENALNQASSHVTKLENLKNQKALYQKDLESINWINVFKTRENFAKKENLTKLIEKNERQEQYHDTKLEFHRNKFNFKTTQQFHEIRANLKSEKFQQNLKYEQQTTKIREERQLLQKADKALENAEIRKFASQNKDWEAAKYLSKESAQYLTKMNEKYKRKLTPADVRAMLDKKKREIEQYQQKMQQIKEEKENLEKAKKQMEKLKGLDQEIENASQRKPLFGIFNKNTSKENVESLQKQQEIVKKMLEKQGIRSEGDLKTRLEKSNKEESKIQEYEKQINQVQQKDIPLKDLKEIDRTMQKAEQTLKINQLAKQRVNQKNIEKER